VQDAFESALPLVLLQPTRAIAWADKSLCARV
jgi:hypothetical protein